MGVVQIKDHLRVRTKHQKNTKTRPLTSIEVGGKTGMMKMRTAAVKPQLSRVNIVHCLNDEIILIILQSGCNHFCISVSLTS